jgi:hypothetical protein
MAIPKLDVAFSRSNRPQEQNEPNIPSLTRPPMFSVSPNDPQTPHSEETEKNHQEAEELTE